MNQGFKLDVKSAPQEFRDALNVVLQSAGMQSIGLSTAAQILSSPEFVAAANADAETIYHAIDVVCRAFGLPTPKAYGKENSFN